MAPRSFLYRHGRVGQDVVGQAPGEAQLRRRQPGTPVIVQHRGTFNGKRIDLAAIQDPGDRRREPKKLESEQPPGGKPQHRAAFVLQHPSPEQRRGAYKYLTD